MTVLFGADIGAEIYVAFDGELAPVTLHKVSTTIGSHGEPVMTEANHTGQGVRSRWDAKIAALRGYPLTAVKILMLQGDTPAPAIEDGVTYGGFKYRILDVTADPADATWTLAAVLA